MDLALSQDQQLLVNTARALLERRCPPERVQALADDAHGFDLSLWKEMAALGWPGLLIPADLGGSGGSAVARVLLAAGARGRARDLLPELALGERICTVAAIEEDGRLLPEAIAMRVEFGRLAGRKHFVPDARTATEVIVIGRGPNGMTAALLPMDRRGLSAAPLDSMAGHRLFELEFDGVQARAEDFLGAPGAGWTLAGPAFAWGAMAQAADMVGAASRVLDVAVEHARSRSQFGRPIGSFQAVQHACADLYRDVQSARWLAYEAAWKLDGGAPDAADAAAAAKAYGAEACLRVARRAHQIMGAMGYSAEHPLHLFHKRILAGALAWGDRDQHLDAVARSIGLA